MDQDTWWFKWGLPLVLGPTLLGFFMLMFWLQDQPWWNN